MKIIKTCVLSEKTLEKELINSFEMLKTEDTNIITNMNKRV